VYYQWPIECDSQNVSLPLPIHNISCEFTCQSGYYLSDENGNPKCLRCPANTYSKSSQINLLGSDLESKINTFSSVCNSTLDKNHAQGCKDWSISNDSFVELRIDSNSSNKTYKLMNGHEFVYDGFVK
jgi:hypothetical protein